MPVIPDSLPVISAGSHKSAAEGACVMEYVSMLAGEAFSDYPTCTHRALARAAQGANDNLPDDRRHEMVSRINRLFGTNDAEGAEAKRISVGLAKFSAAHAKKSAEGTKGAAADAADAYAAAAADAATYAAAYAYAAAADAFAAAAADAAADAAAYAAAYADARASARLAFLDDLLGEYDRLTGRTSVESISDNISSVACKVGAHA
jgi:hypothetical protein